MPASYYQERAFEISAVLVLALYCVTSLAMGSLVGHRESAASAADELHRILRTPLAASRLRATSTPLRARWKQMSQTQWTSEGEQGAPPMV